VSGVLSALRCFDARVCSLFDSVGLETSLLPYDLRFFGEGVGPHFQSLSSKATGLFRLIGENVRLLVEAIGLDACLVFDRRGALLRVSSQPVRLLLLGRSLASNGERNSGQGKARAHPIHTSSQS
jgi:hypothetical protein